MIKVYLEGHDYKYEVQTLLRIFYFNSRIDFIESKVLDNNQDLLIENVLFSDNDKYGVETKVIKENECISRHIIKDVNKIDIKEDNIIKKIKIAIKQSLYEALSVVNDTSTPWGILTGIRPTKIIHDLLDRGYSVKDTEKVLTETYKVSKEKTELIQRIAQRERKYLYPLDKNKFSLYISIPFCPTRCLYCSFPSNTLSRWDHLVDNYTDKLIYELDKIGELMKDKEIVSVYIGGGTPTSIPTENLDKIIKEVYRNFSKDTLKEFTVEAGRPDTINREVLEMLKENNIGRISINPQTMNSSTLKLIGRKHTPEDIISSYLLAREVGFDTINMDLIIGLPEEEAKDVEFTMKEIAKLNPDNLTVHTMAVKRASRLKENIDKFNMTDQSKVEEMLNITRKYTRDMDMHPYYLYRQKQILGNFENIGYAKDGKECIYNILIMEERQTIIAAGAGGISKFFYPNENRIERVPNVKDLNEYLSRIDEMIDRKKKFLKTVDID
jgi:oxygen-independent coproporphyrinogen-3 oxidase